MNVKFVLVNLGQPAVNLDAERTLGRQVLRLHQRGPKTEDQNDT